MVISSRTFQLFRVFGVACLFALPVRTHAQDVTKTDTATKARNAATLAIGSALLDADEAAQHEAIKWLLGDWTYTTDAPFADPSEMPVHFALGGQVEIPGGSMMQIVDSLGNLTLIAQVSDEGELHWGMVSKTDRCGGNAQWTPVKIEFSADRKRGKVLLPMVDYKCEIVYSAEQASGTLTKR